MTRSEEFTLTVEVPADEWALAARRLRFLETLVVRLARDRSLMREWYEAGELAALRLPGLPATRAGIAKRAAARRWMSRPGNGRRLYHISSLPGPAFDALVGRILDLPADAGAVPDIGAITPDAVTAPDGENTAPPWVLPLMRLMKGKAAGDLARAWAELPAHLPAGVPLPTVEDAAETLVRLGLA